jgi:hypothetical protein
LNLLGQSVVRRTLVVAVGITIVSPVQAQTTADPHRWAGGLSVDFGGIPDAFGQRCGSAGASLIYGAGFTVVHRPRRGLVAVFDARASRVIDVFSCRLAVASPVPIGANEFEEGPYRAYSPGTPKAPLRRTSVRIGVEAPPDRGVLRATIGGGWLWSGAQRPFATGAFEIGTNNAGLRFVAGIETSMAWVRVGQEYRRFRRDGEIQTPLPSRFELHVERKHWTIARIGIELPLSEAR